MADITKANEQIAAWNRNLERLKNGEFGAYKNSEESIEALLRYWKAQAEAGYPSASENVKYFEQLIEKERKKRQDFTEYNTKYYPLINNTHILMGYPFDHALKKAESYEEAISNLKILGWNDEWKNFVLEAVNRYANFLKHNAPFIQEGEKTEPNRKQIINALKCGATPMQRDALDLINYYEQKIFELETRLIECENGYEGTLHFERCKLHDAEQKIKELTEENERLRNDRGALCSHIVYTETEKRITIADTVRKMQEEARQRCFMVGVEEFVALYDLEQIAKEILEGV